MTEMDVTNLLSQWPTSGRWAHWTPVWFRERSSLQHSSVNGGVAKASHFSEHISEPEWENVWLFLERTICSSSSRCSLKYLRQTSWKTVRQRVLSRKYHVWCSSSTKLLAAKLRVWPTVPASSKTSNSDSIHSPPELLCVDCERKGRGTLKQKHHIRLKGFLESFCKPKK